MAETGTAKSRLAFLADVPEGCTRNIASDEWNPTAETLRKLEAVVVKNKNKNKKPSSK